MTGRAPMRCRTLAEVGREHRWGASPVPDYPDFRGNEFFGVELNRRTALQIVGIAARKLGIHFQAGTDGWKLLPHMKQRLMKQMLTNLIDCYQSDTPAFDCFSFIRAQD
ncbi:hypothetical protein [Paraburkholderia caballeronis]|uniref:hypothetical protein n=1 Tax=Paraburkholderia caballeronis TaxID=416943 RepID=UPI00106613BA|nr:hypothetical protein [Paraburkholderia caballeronis]